MPTVQSDLAWTPNPSKEVLVRIDTYGHLTSLTNRRHSTIIDRVECDDGAERFTEQGGGGWRDVGRWIVIHWFELATLALLCLNLWFVSATLSVLRSVNNWLVFFARWVEETKRETTPQSESD
jgi:hypothetical protein